MSNNFKILETNDHLGLVKGVYQDKAISVRGSADNELTRSVQTEVAQVFATVDDKSLFSLDLKHALKTSSLIKALSARPYHFLRAFNFNDLGNALDLTQDLGGIAHFLSDQAKSVDSIKINPAIASLAQVRCANKSNIVTISEDLNRLTFENAYYDLIVIGNLADLNLNNAELNNLLRSLQASLSSNGVLVCSALNKNRVSKWFNPEDMTYGTDINYRGLYGHPKQDSDEHLAITQVELSELNHRLRSANFKAININGTFATEGNYNNLFSADYLSNSLNPINHFYRLGSINNPQVSEFLLFKNMHDNKERLIDYADQYLIIAGASNHHIRELYDNDFSYFPSNSRKNEWCAITSRARSASVVEKHAAYNDSKPQDNPPPQDNQKVKSKLLSQNLQPQPFHQGHLLVQDWLDAILNNDGKQFRKLVTEYADWLQQLYQSEDFQKIAYDLLPFNVIVGKTGAQRQLLPIDTEWQLNKKFTPDFVLFRALFWFAFENSTLLEHYAQRHHCPNIGMFVVSNMSNVKAIDELAKFVKLEEKIHSKISNEFRKKAVHHSLTQPLFRVQSDEQHAIRVHAAWCSKDKTDKEPISNHTYWSKSSEPESINIALQPFDKNQPLLTLTAASSSGAFELFSLEILNENQESIWSANSPKKINAAVSLKRALHNAKYFAVRNTEPPIMFDLNNIENIDKAHTLIVKLSWLTSHRSESLVNVNLQTDLIDHSSLLQANQLNEYRADIEFLNSRIDNLVHRNTLLNASDTDSLKRIDNLQARLDAQLVRNEELHLFLLLRPGTRAKRLATRTLNRITGNRTLEPAAPEAAAPTIQIPEHCIGQNYEDYGLWVAQQTLSEQDIANAKTDIDAMEHKPIFSILVPIYNTDPEYLIPMIRSVQKQVYPHWQLCLVDDCSPKSYLRGILEHEAAQDERISIQLNEVNQGIGLTTNDALAMATGDYIALLDHDDEISIDALYENAKVINQTPQAGLIYSDEDKMDMQGNREEPYFKPDYSPDLLHTNNYVCHFTVIKKTIADEIGGFREGLDGSQDHDIILRAAATAEKIVHIPKILYHWRKIPGSTAVAYDSKSYAWEAGRKAVEDMLNMQEEGTRVEFGSLKGTYRVFREIKGEPLVSIIIPFKDKPELLDSCLNSIINRSSYANIEIIGVSNNSEQALTFERMEHFKQLDDRIRFVEKNIPFNFSAICNYGAEHAQGEYVIMLNNDIEIISPDWIERMLEHAQRPEIGAVGGKLLYPDGRIQHAGVVVGMVGAAGHPHKFFPNQHIGYHGRLQMVYNVSAVTGAMMMMNIDKFKEVQGFDEDNLAIAYNDIDLCLKLMDKGYNNLFTPHACATHYESISRGYEDTDEKMQRLLKEQNYFLTKWDDFISAGDPYYNPNLSLENEKFSLKYKD